MKNDSALLLILILTIAGTPFAFPDLAHGRPQNSGASSDQSAATPSDGKTRIYVTDSESWQLEGGWAANDHRAGGAVSGGSRPQNAEIIKTFSQRCPAMIVTDNKTRANYVIILDHEGGEGFSRKDNKIVVFNRDGDAIFSDSTRSLGNAVKDACVAIKRNK